MTRLRAIWHDVNASYWFYPAVFSLLAVALALWTIWLDRNGFASWLDNVSALVPARPDGASNMLTVIAGSMIGVASTVFSITIAAVAYASGNYGPRLLTNFMEDRGNQFSLATFIATFVYSLTVLRSVRASDETTTIFGDPSASGPPGFVPQLSLLVAYLLVGISVAVLVYFLNHIPASIRINTVLKGIGQRLVDMVKSRYPEKHRGETVHERPEGRRIVAESTGYIQLIDFDELCSIAEREDGRLSMHVRTGDFVHPDMVLARWQADADDADADADAPPADAVRDCFALGGRRTPNQDIDFLLDELVEIALRALSPGINDPFTAITALDWLGAATAELGYRHLDFIRARMGDAEGAPRVLPLDDGFAHFLRRGFGAVRGSAATNRIAAEHFMEALLDSVTRISDPTRKAMLRREGDLLLEQARLHLEGPELAMLEERHQAFAERFEAPAISL